MNPERFDELARAFAAKRITRGQVLKGLGGGAATLGLGYLQACSFCERKGKEDPQAVVRDRMGDKAASYFGRRVRDPAVIDYIDARAASFGSACNLGGGPGGLGLAVVSSGSLPVLDIGGQFTNDQSFLAFIDLEASPAFVKYFSEETGREVKKGNVFAYFVTTRFFDAGVSNLQHFPVVGIVDAVMVIATDNATGGRPSMIEMYQVDCGGVRRLRKVRINQDAPPPTDAIDKNKNLVGREDRVNAYFGYLVGEYNGEKGLLPYDPMDFRDPVGPRSRRKSYAGIQGVQYQDVDPYVPHDQWAEPSVPNDTGGPELLTDVYRDAEMGPLVAFSGPVITMRPPEPQPMGYGDPAGRQIGDFTCYKYEALDNCKGCCSSTGLLGLELIGGGVVACIAATWYSPPCWVIPIIGNVSCTAACAAAGAVLVLVNRYKESMCDANCYTRVPL